MYHVVIRSDGRDCDGYIDYGKREEVMPLDELQRHIGSYSMKHGDCRVMDHDEQLKSITLVFSSPNDEGGYFRTVLTYWEASA